MNGIALCNLALSRIGTGKPITDLDDKSREARACKLVYEHTRDVLMEEYPWPFCTATETLALLSDDPPVGWEYRYAYPSDCLSARQLVDTIRRKRRNKMRPFQVRPTTDGKAKSIVTDEPEAILEFTKRIEDEILWPASFRNAFAWRLSGELAISLTEDPARLQTALQLYELSLQRAAAVVLNEGIEDMPAESELNAGRWE